MVTDTALARVADSHRAPFLRLVGSLSLIRCSARSKGLNFHIVRVAQNAQVPRLACDPPPAGDRLRF